MWKYYLLAITAAVLSFEGTSAISYSTLPSTTSVVVGGNLTFTVNITDVTTETTLNWVVGDDYIGNITLSVTDGNTTLTTMKTKDETFYSFEVDTNGNNVTVIFRLLNISADYDGKMVKLVLGASDNVTTTLSVREKEDGEPVTTTAPETGAPTDGMTSPTAVASSNDTSQDTTTSETGDGSVTSAPTPTSTDGTTPTATDPGPDCGSPPAGYDANCTTVGCNATNSYEVRNPNGHGTKFLFTNTTTCATEGSQTEWTVPEITKDGEVCNVSHLYGADCLLTCGPGCEGGCDETGKCIGEADGVDGCKDGYKGRKYCNESICDPQHCNGGECVAPGVCAFCPHQFAPHYVDETKQITCRNLRLDGFLRGSLPALAVLAAIVIALTFGSKWYIKRKLKEH